MSGHSFNCICKRKCNIPSVRHNICPDYFSGLMIFHNIKPLSNFFNYQFCPDYFLLTTDLNSQVSLQWSCAYKHHVSVQWFPNVTPFQAFSVSTDCNSSKLHRKLYYEEEPCLLATCSGWVLFHQNASFTLF